MACVVAYAIALTAATATGPQPALIPRLSLDMQSAPLGATAGLADSAGGGADGDYTWQLLALDGVAAALITVGLLEDNLALAWAGGGVYVVAGPTIHLGHGRYGPAQNSLLVRLIAPGIAGLVGGALAGGGGEPGDRTLLEKAGPGLLVGALLAMVVDSLILTRPDQ